MLQVPFPVVRLAFEALYGPFAWAYDWVSQTFFLGQWAYWQRAPLAEIRGRVLEVGFGTGVLLEEADRRGLEWTGIERSPDMIRQARRRLDRQGLAARIARGDVRSLPIATASVDHVVSTFPSEYISRPETLAEIDRILRPGGSILVVPAGMVLPAGPPGRALERFHRSVYGDAPPPVALPGPAGFCWTSRWVPSPRGRCILLIGRRIAD